MKGNICSVFLTVFLSTAAQVSAGFGTYRAAVVEFNPLVATPNAGNDNVKKYIEFIKEAKKKEAAIIVFPEHGLFINEPAPIPNPTEHIAPCDLDKAQTSQAVQNLSKAARDYKIYTVVNLLEKRKCESDEESCSSSGFHTYNTNVVFDRNGVVIARYAKFNLYETDTAEHPKDPELVFFDTDFGVRFGTFICFDILFSTPGQRLVQQYQITDFVYTTFWYSELPFLTALQAQRGWAETNNVNFLASGVNLPSSASFGSGIYNGKFGHLVEFMSEKETSKLIIADVPKFKSSLDVCQKENFSFLEPKETAPHVHYPVLLSNRSEKIVSNELVIPYGKDDLKMYATEVISGGEIFEKKICSYKEFCCEFKVMMDALKVESKNYIYRAVVYNGKRNFGFKFSGGVQTCGIVACDGPHIANCTGRIQKLPELFVFKEIQIKGNFNRKNSFQMPSTLTDGKEVKPLPANKYEFVKNDNGKTMEVSLELLWPVVDLRTFAIWGRDFTRDMEPNVPQSRASAILSLPVLIATYIGFVLFAR